jgi:hypothetical protein
MALFARGLGHGWLRHLLLVDSQPGRVPAVDLAANPLHDVRVQHAIQSARTWIG